MESSPCSTLQSWHTCSSSGARRDGLVHGVTKSGSAFDQSVSGVSPPAGTRKYPNQLGRLCNRPLRARRWDPRGKSLAEFNNDALHRDEFSIRLLLPALKPASQTRRCETGLPALPSLEPCSGHSPTCRFFPRHHPFPSADIGFPGFLSRLDQQNNIPQPSMHRPSIAKSAASLMFDPRLEHLHRVTWCPRVALENYM
jgi:hypothetical protein